VNEPALWKQILAAIGLSCVLVLAAYIFTIGLVGVSEILDAHTPLFGY